MKKRSVTPLFSLSVRCRMPSSCPNSPRRRSLFVRSPRAFLHGAPDAQPLHVLVGRYFRVDMVSLDHQRQRHAHDEEGYGAEGEEEND